MDNKCLLVKLEEEILPHIQRDGSCTLLRLMELIGPDHKKYEFWAVLQYHLNSKFGVSRDAKTGGLIFHSKFEVLNANPGSWYERIKLAKEFNTPFKFFIPPIDSSSLRKALAKQHVADTVSSATERLISQFPELNMLEQQSIRLDIIMPALYGMLSNPRSRSPKGKFISSSI